MLSRTPSRVAESLAWLLTKPPLELTTFPNDEGYNQLVVARNIPVSSLCEHHLLPFAGVAHVGYLPADKIVGLSKLGHVVDHVAHGLQTQERLTEQVAKLLSSELQPKGVGVIVEAEHMCMSMRGARTPGVSTVTSALHGLVRTDPRTRQEFLALANG